MILYHTEILDFKLDKVSGWDCHCLPVVLGMLYIWEGYKYGILSKEKAVRKEGCK